MKKRILYHIVFWVAYVLFKSYLNVESDPTHLTVRMLMVLIGSQAVFLVIKVPMVYTVFYIVERYLARQWSLTRTILTTLGLFIVSVALFIPLKHYIVLKEIYRIPAALKDGFSFVAIWYTFFLLCFTCSIAVAIKLIRSNIRQRQAEQEMIKRKLETELRFLKAQINPHFLFNTLNNIYALARKRSDDTANVVMKLSKLLRFILYESQKKYISIADEIQVLENYIELECIRYDDKLQVRFAKTIDNETQRIAPLILLPFVENMFKHGASESRFSSYISIDLKLKQRQLYFTCENSKMENVSNDETGKIGLVNIRRQLELLYPGHTLEIENTSNRFKVYLQINLYSGKGLMEAGEKHELGSVRYEV